MDKALTIQFRREPGYVVVPAAQKYIMAYIIRAMRRSAAVS
jgi:hypothetical protein